MLDVVRLLYPFFVREWRRFLLFALATPLVFALDLAILAGGGRLLDQLRGASSLASLSFLPVALLGAATLLAEGLRTGQSYLLSTLNLRVCAALQNALVGKILRAPYAVFQTITSGGKSKRILRDAEQVSFFTESLASLFLREPLRVVLLSGLILYWSPLLFSVLAGVLAAGLALSWFIGKALAALYERTNAQESFLFQKLQKLLANWVLVKSCRMEERESENWNRETSRYCRLQARATAYNLAHPVVFRCLFVAAAALLWWIWASTGAVPFETAGGWVKGGGAVLLWAQSLKNLASSCLGLVEEGVRAAQLAEILKWPAESGKNGAPYGMLTGLSVENLRFGYEKSRQLFSGLSFSLKRGETLLVCGPNGSGKTTLAYLLLGFLNPDSGAVLFNGRKVEPADIAWVRQQSGIVFQQPQLLEATLAENLFYGANGRPREEGLEALRAAGLGHLEEFYVSGGLLGEAGRELSYGEKQKLALARALLLNPDFLILDEATSGLDVAGEEKLVSELLRRRRDKITVVIAHKWRSEGEGMRRLELGTGKRNA